MKDPQESDESESSDSWKPEEISYKKYDLHTVSEYTYWKFPSEHLFGPPHELYKILNDLKLILLISEITQNTFLKLVLITTINLSTFLAKFLKSGINKNVNPCNNFYEYVCGKWAENNKNPDGYGTWDTHKITQYNIISTMRGKLKHAYMFTCFSSYMGVSLKLLTFQWQFFSMTVWKLCLHKLWIPSFQIT